MHSMTGYGTAEGKAGQGRLFVEIKSVNHRYNELIVKIPGRMTSIEHLIRKRIQEKFGRGKFDIFIKEKEPLFGGVEITIDTKLAKRYQLAIKNLKKELGLSGEVDFFHTVGLDRIIQIEERGGSYEKLWPQISKVIDSAIKHVFVMRLAEGKHIAADQKKRLALVAGMVKSMKKHSQRARNNNIARIKSRMNGVLGDTPMEEQRLQLEAAYLGGRQDISEELVRLESHLNQYRGLLSGRDAIGRKLDFLLQEMNREINTIGSKASDSDISKIVVECKAELERLREQVQNVE